ncbi:MAG: hypothetical protein KDA24_18880 [Deltaproteobacteria bacterium]|nr:hypothetical protein [Deltaproteobacteria bacterium]
MLSTLLSIFLSAALLVALTPGEASAATASDFRSRLTETLTTRAVAGDTLGAHLTRLDSAGCLREVEAELVEGLHAIEALFSEQVEATSFDQSWKEFAPQLNSFSPDGRLLVATWLDNEELARTRFFCEDGLPSSWIHVSTTRHVVESVLWFDLAIAEREGRLIEGNQAEREAAVLELLELRRALVHRHQATYAQDRQSDELLAVLEHRLALMWEVLVEPFHLGFAPKAVLDSEDGGWGSPAGAASPRPNGFYGMDIPDPRDVAQRDAIRRGWRRQTKTLRRETRQLTRERQRLAGAISFAGDGPELDPLVREAVELDRRLSLVLGDLSQLEHRVRSFETGSPIVASMVAAGPLKGTVRSIALLESATESDRLELGYAVTDAVMRGASTPDLLMPSSLDEAVAALEDIDLSVVGDPDALPSPGNWLAGIPGLGRGDSGDESARLAVEKLKDLMGTGWVERSYDGPIPAPSAEWSQDLVNAVRGEDPSIDETDARILLGLIEAAYSELPDRPAVELAVRYAMRRGGGLQLTGNEGQLSELYDATRPATEQQELVFVLKLLF